MSSKDLAPIWTPPISERAELTQWVLYIINQYSKPELSGSSKHPMYGMRWSPPGRELWLSNILFCTPNIAPVFFYSCSRSFFSFLHIFFTFFLLFKYDSIFNNTASFAVPQISLCRRIEPRTVATLALAVRRFNHSARFHPSFYNYVVWFRM